MLYGRAAESATLASVVAEARAGRGGALVVRGVESESPLAFAALQRLLRPLLPHLGRLPGPQAAETYTIACLSFDLVVAAYVVVAYRLGLVGDRGRALAPRRAEIA